MYCYKIRLKRKTLKFDTLMFCVGYGMKERQRIKNFCKNTFPDFEIVSIKPERSKQQNINH